MTSAELVELFEREYLLDTPLRLLEAHAADDGNGRITLEATVADSSGERTLWGEGNGPIDALVAALRAELVVELHVRNYHEHAIDSGEDAAAVAYVEMLVAGRKHFGAGRDRNITKASLLAVLSAVNRAVRHDNLRCGGLPAMERMEDRAPVAL